MSQKPEALPGSQAQAGQVSTPEVNVLWVGTDSGMEADLVKREGLRFESIPAAGLHGVGLTSLPGNLWRLGRGFFASRRILRKFNPDVLFYTGGYVAVPMALAARVSGHARSLLYVPDIEPGLAIKTIARFSDCLTLTIEESGSYFANHPNKVVTGYPLRPGMERWTNEQARSFFALQELMPVLLVFGGSQGAHSINQALAGMLNELLQEMQVIHITGRGDWQMMERVRNHLPSQLLNRYRPYPYLYEEIGAAMHLANLAVTRAGASTLGELPLFGLPAILVPYPYAWRYQRQNASYLVKHGAAELLEDGELNGQLLKRVCDLMADRTRLEKMSEAMRALAKPEASSQIAGLLAGLASPATAIEAKDVPNPSD